MAKKSKYLSDEEIWELLQPYAYKILKDVSTESHRAIDAFYGGYSPKMYQRTFGMKNLFKPTMRKIENGYEIEFTYATEFLTTWHRSNEDVFEGSFVYGWHGGRYAWGHPKAEIPRTTPSPWRAIEIYVLTYKL